MSKSMPPAKPSPVLLRIRKEAASRGLTAYALAKATGLGISTLQRLLDGTTSPSLTTLESVVAALGMEVTLKRRGG